MRSILKSAAQFCAAAPPPTQSPSSGASNPFRSVKQDIDPRTNPVRYRQLAVGVNLTGTKRTPAIPRAFKYAANSLPLIHGAPTSSKRSIGTAGPTRHVRAFNQRPLPDGQCRLRYCSASSCDGFTQPNSCRVEPVAPLPSIHRNNRQLGIDVALSVETSSPVRPSSSHAAPAPSSSLSEALAPRVRHTTGPCTNDPVTGSGRSSTINSMPAFAAASRKYPSVVSNKYKAHSCILNMSKTTASRFFITSARRTPRRITPAINASTQEYPSPRPWNY